MQRLGKNLGKYFGETINIAGVLRDMESAAEQKGWSVEVFHEAHDFQYLALTRSASHAKPPGPNVYISAGIHGDEPAGPLAALRLIQENRWPTHMNIWLCPCLNPPGFALNRRENADGKDLNRDYLNPVTAEIRAHTDWLEQQPQFDLSLCLHEDWESHGFYVYELNLDGKPSIAEAIVKKVAEVCPVDPSDIIEGRPARGGIIRPDIDPRTRLDWPEAFWLVTHKTRQSSTLEAPSDFPLQTRVDALVAGVNAALKSIAI